MGRDTLITSSAVTGFVLAFLCLSTSCVSGVPEKIPIGKLSLRDTAEVVESNKLVPEARSFLTVCNEARRDKKEK